MAPGRLCLGRAASDCPVNVTFKPDRAPNRTLFVVVSGLRSIPKKVISGILLAAVLCTGAVSSANYPASRVDVGAAICIASAAVFMAPAGARLTGDIDSRGDQVLSGRRGGGSLLPLGPQSTKSTFSSSAAQTTSEHHHLRVDRQLSLIAWNIRNAKKLISFISCGTLPRDKHVEMTFEVKEQELSHGASERFESTNKSFELAMKTTAYSGEGALQTQVGGHAGAFKMDGPTLRKLVMDIPELEFYKKLEAAEKAGDEAHLWPARFCARYSGTEIVDEQEYMILENLTFPYEKPCVMDLKIGTRTAEADASIYKRVKMQIRDEISGAAITGVQLIAMSINRPKEQMAYKMSKAKGYKFTIATPLEQIIGFFLSDGNRIDTALIRQFKAKVQALLDAFLAQRTYQFVGSSLLFTFEGKPKKGKQPHCDLRMIDFAHALEPEEAKTQGDPYYVTGLESILVALGNLEKARHLGKTGVEHIHAANMAKRWHTATKSKQQNRQGGESSSTAPSDQEPPAQQNTVDPALVMLKVAEDQELQ